MANNYYSPTSVTAFTTAKAADVNSNTTAIEDGFDLLPTPKELGTGPGWTQAAYFATGTNEGHGTNIKQIRDGAFFVGANNSSAADAYAITLTPAPAAYTAGMIVCFKVPTATTNTGACTLNCNSLGVKSIKSTDGGDPAANELYAGAYAWLQYDGTNFQLLFPAMPALSAPSVTIPAVSASEAYHGIRMNSAGTAYELGPPIVYPNRVLNSEMMIDQRNVGAAVTTTASYIVDRIKISWANTDQLVISAQQTTGIGGYRNSAKVTASTAETAWAADEYVTPFEYRFLGYDVADLVNGASVTISFYFKSNAASGSKFAVTLQAGNNGYSYTTDFTYTTTATVQLITKTIVVPAHASNYVSNTTTGCGMRILIAAYGGTDYQGTADQWNAANDLCSATVTDWTQTGADASEGYVQITALQFAVGSDHTPLKIKTRSDYLDECLPYYQKSFNQSVAVAQASASYLGCIGYGVTVAGVTSHSVRVNFARPMVGTPTITFYNPISANGKWYNASVPDAADSGTPDSLVTTTTAGQSGFVAANPGVAADSVGDAVAIHYSASAEI